MTKNRPNTSYITIWKKTHELFKKLSKQLGEPMTFVIQRAAELLDKEINK